MQTYLPHPDYEASAAILDPVRCKADSRGLPDTHRPRTVLPPSRLPDVERPRRLAVGVPYGLLPGVHTPHGQDPQLPA